MLHGYSYNKYFFVLARWHQRIYSRNPIQWNLELDVIVHSDQVVDKYKYKYGMGMVVYVLCVFT